MNTDNYTSIKSTIPKKKKRPSVRESFKIELLKLANEIAKNNKEGIIYDFGSVAVAYLQLRELIR